MMIEPIAALAPTEATSLLQGVALEAGRTDHLASTQVSAASGFGQMVSHGIGAVNHDLIASQTDLQELATGNVQNLHQIMIRLEETRLSFQLFMQVRNRLLEAYQDIMKMQV